MTDGWVFLGLSAAICAGVFASGLRFARMATHPGAGREPPGQPIKSQPTTLAQLNRFGRLMMIGAVIMLVFAAALTFGLLGPVQGIRTIEL